MQILGIVLSLFGVIYLWVAAIIPVDSWAAEEAINSRTLPMVYGFVFLLACWLLLIKGRGQADMTLGGLRRVAALLVCLVAFALAVPTLGVWLATPVLLVPALWVMGERRWWTLSLVPVLTAFVGWGLIEGLLDVYVPGGALFAASFEASFEAG
jgi:hypothetical protein